MAALVAMVGCDGGDNGKLAEGVFAPLGEPLPSATAEQLELFERGKEVGLHRFTRETGLGPKFNVTFCTACHERPTEGGSAPRYRDFLIVGRELSDGSFVTTGVNGIQDQYTLEPLERNPTAEDAEIMAKRNAIGFFGVGLLAELEEEEILRNADPDDRDGDGISGRPNFDRGFAGRFGRKAQTVSIEGFIRGPLFNHLGVTTNPLPPELKAALPVPSVADGDVGGRGAPLRDPQTGDADSERPPRNVGAVVHAQAAAPEEPNMDDDGVPDPEMSDEDLFHLVSFSMLLAAPQPDEPTPQTERGKSLFEQANCTGCHVESLRGPRGRLPLYSDLLLHDMGPDMADGVQQGRATGSEFRTQPLWGIAAMQPYLHDGRADTLDEAIRHHGGEAAAARDAYLAMSDRDRQDIVAFLESLGGKSQQSEGLLPPDAEVPPAGDYGGPLLALEGEQLRMFERGRAVFDRDALAGTGLGPRFNGDSCRACHFDPAVGGAGPADVDVSRQGILDFETGTFTEPANGTMAHKLALESTRPPTDPACNVFEVRQTPAIFGFGLIDRIPDGTILALEDPDDTDGDGISGRAHVLPDGRLGRLGWKANVPSLAEFARDGLANEMGVTLPEQQDMTFGVLADDDEIPDPEISLEDVEALVFFMEQLAPPPRTRTEPAMEDAGEQVFEAIGCASCHVPELETVDGTAVPLYSDILLHDVADPDDGGIGAGDASYREFRTAPLWGVSQTPPYMHDGRAFTLEEAIALHDSEAAAARDAYTMLGAEERAQLLAFLQSL